LWCIWEIFTLFAFSSKKQATEKIVFVPLTDETQDASSVLLGLENFSLSSAHCFDPNEESRLRDIIHARGDEVFENRVRELAGFCIGGLRERSKTTLSSLFRTNQISFLATQRSQRGVLTGSSGSMRSASSSTEDSDLGDEGADLKASSRQAAPLRRTSDGTHV
jgi:hypothetical protein